MKKLFVTLVTMVAAGTAFALPVGNPSEASLFCEGLFFDSCEDDCNPCLSFFGNSFSFRLGYYGDFVFNRHLRVRHNSKAVIEKVELFTNAAYFDLNFCNRFDLFATVGSTTLDLETNSNAFAVPVGARFVIESGPGCASWSVGARATLWRCGCTTLGLEGQYFRVKPSIKRVSLEDLNSFYTDNFYRPKYDEWQVGLGLSHRICCVVPYVALKWARARWDIGGPVFVFGDFPTDPFVMKDLENRKSWGYAVGVTVLDCEKAALTVEGRFASEAAVYVNGQVRF